MDVGALLGVWGGLLDVGGLLGDCGVVRCLGRAVGCWGDCLDVGGLLDAWVLGVVGCLSGLSGV